MKAAVVIVTYNSDATLSTCLDALAKQTLEPAHILVIDNASPNGFPHEAVLNRSGLQLILNRENVGFAAANNQALNILEEDTSIDLVALLNPDAYPEPDWLAELVDAAHHFADFDAFASRMMLAGTDDTVDGMGDEYHMSGLAWREGHGKRLCPGYLVSREVFGVCAGAALYRLSALKTLGGFDADLFCYMEDVDLSFRLRLIGRRCRYVPNAVVWHVGGESTRDNAAFRLYYGHRNMVRVYLKNMPTALLLLTLPAHLVVNAIGVLRSLARGEATTVLRAKLDAIRAFRRVMAQRKDVQRTATIGSRQLWHHVSKALWRNISATGASQGRLNKTGIERAR